MATYVLVHGGFHDGNAWNEVIAGLSRRGHTTYAPTLAGRGKDADTTVTHRQASQSAVEITSSNAIRLTLSSWATAWAVPSSARSSRHP